MISKKARASFEGVVGYTERDLVTSEPEVNRKEREKKKCSLDNETYYNRRFDVGWVDCVGVSTCVRFANDLKLYNGTTIHEHAAIHRGQLGMGSSCCSECRACEQRASAPRSCLPRHAYVRVYAIVVMVPQCSSTVQTCTN